MPELLAGASQRGSTNLLLPCDTKVLLRDGETEALKIWAGGQNGEKGSFPGAVGCSLLAGDRTWGQK